MDSHRLIHDVLTPDNVSMGAMTIDYGPCDFRDASIRPPFSPIDQTGALCYANQPRWRCELTRLAEVPAGPLAGCRRSRGHRDRQRCVGRFLFV